MNCCECHKALDHRHIYAGDKGLIWVCPDCGALTIEGTVSHREIQIVLEEKKQQYEIEAEGVYKSIKGE
jgi:ribosomal protein L37AE/L43A